MSLMAGLSPDFALALLFFLLDLGFVISSEEGRLLELEEFFESRATLASRTFICSCCDWMVLLKSHRTLVTTFAPALYSANASSGVTA